MKSFSSIYNFLNWLNHALSLLRSAQIPSNLNGTSIDHTKNYFYCKIAQHRPKHSNYRKTAPGIRECGCWWRRSRARSPCVRLPSASATRPRDTARIWFVGLWRRNRELSRTTYPNVWFFLDWNVINVWLYNWRGATNLWPCLWWWRRRTALSLWGCCRSSCRPGRRRFPFRSFLGWVCRLSCRRLLLDARSGPPPLRLRWFRSPPLNQEGGI